MPRIGVAYAGPIWGNKKYRFVVQSRKEVALKNTL
jgi:hypothetical protein